MSGAGKGDVYRPVDRKKYEAGWELAFGNKTCLWHICISCTKEFCNERTIEYGKSNIRKPGDKVRKGKGRDAGQDQTGNVPGPKHGDGDKV